MTDLPIRDVVPAHRFDEARLAAWMTANVDGYQAPLRVQQFQGGASNPTYLLTAGDGPLPGKLLPSAHQVDREYRVMKALHGHIPVPVMRALCEDPEVIGATFYVMDYLEGRIFRDATLPGLEPAERAAIYDDLNATLAKLHKVDFEAVGLERRAVIGDGLRLLPARGQQERQDQNQTSVQRLTAGRWS